MSERRRRIPIWPFRRIVQISVVALLIALPVISRYRHYLSARELDDLMERWDGSVQGETLAFTDAAVRVGIADGEGGVETRRPRQAVLERTRQVGGSAWSANLFGLSLTDPLAGAESAVASRALPWVLVVGLIVPLLVTLILGRVFCGWVCPGGLLFDIGEKIRWGLRRGLEIRPLEVELWSATKYVLLGVGLLVAAVSGATVLRGIYPPAILGREAHAFVEALFDRAESGRPGFAVVGISAGTVLLLVILAVEVLVAPRFFCKTICPGGALYSLLGRARLLRVRRREADCTDCTLCDNRCPRGMLPMTDVTGSECDACGVCVDVCPTQALVFRPGWSGDKIVGPSAPTAPDPAEAFPATGGGVAAAAGPALGTIAVATALVTAVFAAAPRPALAHHIMGVPHYSYDENYPQAPVLKLVDTVGDWQLQLTGYPGNPVPGEPTELHVYVVRELDRAVYDLPVSVTIRQQHLGGSRETIFGPADARRSENVFKFYPTYPEEGHYEVTIGFEDGAEGISTLTFPLVVGEPGSPWVPVALFGGGLVLLLLVVRAIKIKQARRARAAARREGGTS